jgi:PRC-barrel domain
MMDHSTHAPLTGAELTEANVVGAPIYGEDDEKVGTISHLHGNGASAQAVIDVGGFLGIGSKSVLVSLSQLHMMRDTNGNIHGITSWTKSQLEALPEHHH